MLEWLIVLGVVVIYAIPTIALWLAGRRSNTAAPRHENTEGTQIPVPGFDESIRWTHFLGTLAKMNVSSMAANTHTKMPTNNHFEESQWYGNTSALHSSR